MWSACIQADLLTVQDEAMFRRLRWWQDIAARGRRIAKEVLGFLQLWRKSIQQVEGKHGERDVQVM